MSVRLHHDVKGCNTPSCEISTNTGQSLNHCKSFTIVEDSIDAFEFTPGAERSYRKLKRLIRLTGGSLDWSMRRLAAHLGISIRSCQYHLKAIHRAGLISIEQRRGMGCRLSETNIIRLARGGATKFTQKLVPEKNLTPKAHTREKPRIVSSPPVDKPAESEVRQAWEARREQDRRDHEQVKAMFAAIGRSIAADRESRIRAREENRRWWREGNRGRWNHGRQHRREMAQERNQRAMVGVYMGPKTPVTPEEEAKNAEIREKERAGRLEYQRKIGKLPSAERVGRNQLREAETSVLLH